MDLGQIYRRAGNGTALVYTPVLVRSGLPIASAAHAPPVIAVTRMHEVVALAFPLQLFSHWVVIAVLQRARGLLRVSEPFGHMLTIGSSFHLLNFAFLLAVKVATVRQEEAGFALPVSFDGLLIPVIHLRYASWPPAGCLSSEQPCVANST